MNYFTSDPHFGHKNIIKWGRPQFKTIEEHDEFLVSKFEEWANKLKASDKLFILGDWGKTDFLFLMSYFHCYTILVMGNHDTHSDIDKFKHYFDAVYEYPIFITDKMCVSHVPQNVFDDQINVHGHLHGNIIDKVNYVSCCLEVNNYELVSERIINSRFARMPKYTRKHLEAPYSEWEKVIFRPQNDLILTPNNHIDLSAMRAWKKIQEQEKN